MMPPTSIDGTDITAATIDGTDVTEITVDGQTVFTSGLANYIFDDFDDNDLTRPRTGQEDGNYTGQDGTIYNDARIRPDWNTSSFVSTTSGQMQLGPGNGLNADRFICSVATSIDFPVTVEFDLTFDINGSNPGDELHFGFATTNQAVRDTTSIFLSLRPATAFGVFEYVNGSEVDRGTIINPTINDGIYKFVLDSNSVTIERPGASDFVYNTVNPQRTDYQYFVFDMFDDDNSNTTNLIDDFKIF